MEKIDVYKKLILYALGMLSVFILGAWVLFKVIGILFIWLIAFMLMTALNPFVEWLEKHRLPRPLGVLLVFIILFGSLALAIFGIIPPLVKETTLLISSLSRTFDYSNIFQIDTNLITSQLQTVSQSLLSMFRFISVAASNIFAVISLIIITVYMLMQRHTLKRYLKFIFRNGDREEQAEIMLNSIEKKLGGWVRGELLLMLLIGFLSYLGLYLMKIPYALPLALLAGLLEVVPNIGPIISAIPAVVFGSTISPALALGVLVLYIAIQQAENHLVVPLVMKQSTGLDPLITLFCLTIGVTLGGVPGAVLAVPLYITGNVVIQSFSYTKKVHARIIREQGESSH